MTTLTNVKHIRLEYSDDKSDKFWELTFCGGIHGTDYTARWGRCGSAGQTTSYSIFEANKKLAEKISKGYAIVDKSEFASSAEEALENIVKQMKPKKQKLPKEEEAFDIFEALSKI
jgi:predicted DNA-binding WGR domain protein